MRTIAPTEPLPVVCNAAVSIFAVVVIDECHRPIYNIWRQVPEYFDASASRPKASIA